ncbi:MAG: NAD(P)-dependent oxidoreductase [Chloroflexota bacterium]|nr:NAD(P)-dependent oxidoreductase [Chloroflexota bacterium]
MPALITGGTGFLGSRLARRLIAGGEDRLVLVDAFPNMDNVADLGDVVEVVRADFSEPNEILPILRKHDFSHLFHLAYLTSESDLFPSQAIRINILGTHNLFDLARQCGIEKVCYPSSAAIYRHRRNSDHLWHEDELPTPSSFYGMCKLANEHDAELLYQKHGLKHVGLRLQSVFGEGRGRRRGIPPDIYARILEQPFRGERFVAPKAEAVMSWTYVDDVAEAFFAAAKADDPPYRVFNVTGEVRTVGDAVKYVRSLVPDASLELGADDAVTLPLATGDRIREVLGFSPAFTMERGLSAYLETLKKERA